ncbi:MAG: DUF2244 domain-containing protein [Hydrogenophilaceae bacterium]|nr:DUF2244 domain-containing protein [Hydrogenophilaceae bacterium]
MPLVLDSFPARRKQEFSFTSRPNCSLSERDRKLFFWAIAGLTLLIASVFAVLGYWLTLPFAGLEIGLLAWAFDSLSRRSGDYETLTIDDDEVVVERRQGDVLEHLELNRQWVSLVQTREHSGRRASVALRSHGKETELGVFLTDEARLELGCKLQSWFRSG